MPNYKFIITLYDSGLPYPDKESAKEAADEWAADIADTEDCQVANVQVDLDEN